jgi:hypothetical protein
MLATFPCSTTHGNTPLTHRGVRPIGEILEEVLAQYRIQEDVSATPTLMEHEMPPDTTPTWALGTYHCISSDWSSSAALAMIN